MCTTNNMLRSLRETGDSAVNLKGVFSIFSLLYVRKERYRGTDIDFPHLSVYARYGKTQGIHVIIKICVLMDEGNLL